MSLPPADFATNSATKPATLVEDFEQLPQGSVLSPGMRLGPYRLVDLLGRGGMGVVWLADQLEPFQRKVAVKLSTQRVGSGLAAAYFHVERQALAQMVHPYIAQIYDAGELPDGALYFAMEYVEGGTLDDLMRKTPLPLGQTIKLLGQLCQGVQYAHQRGLIHRDLKPSNVLVAQVGGLPIPKIIDFGIAIGVDSARGPGGSSSVGTRAYMAPEQAMPTSAGIDTRVDVYALGAILTETICLALGIKLDHVHSEGMRSALSEAGRATGRSARPSQTRLLPLKRIPFELRAIALKAMAVDLEQRYASAAALADDLQRWRERRPVAAVSNSRWYSVRCFVNRFRLATSLAAATVLALILGIVVAGYGLRELQSARALAETRREQAEGLVGYMLGEFADQLRPLGKLDLLNGVSSQALKYLGESQDKNPESALHRATALRTLGEVLTQQVQGAAAKDAPVKDALSAFTAAEGALDYVERANPAQPGLWFERAQVAYWLGYLPYTERRYAQAETHWLRYLQYAEKLLPSTEKTSTGLMETAYALGNLGTLAFETGRLDDAVGYFTRSTALKRDLLAKHPNDNTTAVQLANSISWLGKTQEARGDLRGALASYESQLELCNASHKRDPAADTWLYHLALAQHGIGLLALQTGDLSRASRELQAATQALAELNERDPNQRAWANSLAFTRSSLGWSRYSERDLPGAAKELSMALEILSRSELATNTANSLRGKATALYRLGAVSMEMGEAERASGLMKQSIDILSAQLSENPGDRKSAALWAQAQLLNLEFNNRKDIDSFAKIRASLAPLAADRVDAEILDPWARTLLTLGEYQQAELAMAQLREIGYKHPNFLAFVAQHQRGKSK